MHLRVSHTHTNAMQMFSTSWRSSCSDASRTHKRLLHFHLIHHKYLFILHFYIYLSTNEHIKYIDNLEK